MSTGMVPTNHLKIIGQRVRNILTFFVSSNFQISAPKKSQLKSMRPQSFFSSSRKLTRALNYQIKINKSDYGKEIWSGAVQHAKRWDPNMTHISQVASHRAHIQYAIDQFNFNSFFLHFFRTHIKTKTENELYSYVKILEIPSQWTFIYSSFIHQIVSGR